jgi:3-hydroxyacyl-CoA dehydrogenase
MMSLEKECAAPAKKLLDHYIEAVTEELSIKNNK